MKITEMCEADRPREKMLASGVSSLGDGELLAVLLRTGSRGESALDLSQKLLKAAGGSLVALAGLSPASLCALPGIGRGKAAMLLAAFEIGRRFFAEESRLDKVPLTSPRMVYRMMLPELRGRTREECWVVFLNRSQYCVGRERMTLGSQHATIIDPKDIVRAALERHASEIILVHNHPSGNPRPGERDIEQTRRLKAALAAFEIGLMDHVIVCDDCYFSFSEARVCRI